MKLDYDIIIIGAGPAGIAAAIELKAQGIHDILMLEREEFAGGSARHSFLPTFGVGVFKCPMTGPQFTRKLLRMRGDVPILTGTTVTAIRENGYLNIESNNCDVHELSAKRVILATGAEECIRHPCLSRTNRLQGLLTTNSLQKQINLDKHKPCQNPVIIGTAPISFSSLWTLHKNHIKAAAMIEESDSVTASKPLQLLTSLTKTPIHCNTRLVEIGGEERVEYVDIERNGQRERIACDAVIFTGQFHGVNQLVKNSHLDCDPETGCPTVDALGRCSDGVYYAIGNMLHPADLGDQCYFEGRYTGLAVAYALRVPPVKNSARIAIKHDDNILFTMPSCLTVNGKKQVFDMNIRVKEAISGQLMIKSGDKVLYRSKRNFLPGRRIMLKNIKTKLAPEDAVEISVSIA